MSTRLAGKTAVVTGASQGIGAASAIALAREGARVALVARRIAEGEAVATEARRAAASGGDAFFLQGDVTDEASVANLATTLTDRLGPELHILFNNAGGQVGGGRFPRERLVNFEATLRFSLTSVWMVTQALWPALQAARGASIINNSTAASVGALPQGLEHLASVWFSSGYGAAKAGVEALTRYMAAEGGSLGIRANFVRPGQIETPTALRPDGKHVVHEWGSAVQMISRAGIAEDIAGTVVFLASDESSFITGQGIDVDGGLVNKR